MIVEITKSAQGYQYATFHQEATFTEAAGEARSIASALRAAFSPLQVGEIAEVSLVMNPPENLEDYQYPETRPAIRSARMTKSETPDFERGAKALLAK